MNRNTWFLSTAALWVSLATAVVSRAADFVPLNVEDGIALKGYDAVAYFRVAEPVKGRPQFTHSWKGANWQFSSQANLEAFRTDPERYAPQFGGYCAYAVAHNYVAPIDPNAWHIENGRLYLNYDTGTQEKWLAQRPRFIPKAERNWTKMTAP